MTAAVIELACEGLRCEVLPALGGCIAGLWLDGVPVLRAAADPPALRSAREAGCYPLVPFANRLGHATLQWQGTGPPLVRPGGDEPHAIHGVGWQRPWAVLEQDRIMMEQMELDANERENLYQHDLGIVRLRRHMRNLAVAQLAEAAEPAAAVAA